MRYPYIITDVFSATPFGGNQLAVLTDARGISDDGMQAIAREFNFAETTFVLPPEDPTCVKRVRIFTPGRELPFAGHPTVGTACALVRVGAMPEGAAILEEAIGRVPVQVDCEDGVLHATLTLEQGPDLHENAPSRADTASTLSIPEEEIADIFCAAAGVNFTFVRLGRRETVDRARLNFAEWERAFKEEWGAQLYLFAGDPTDGGELYAQMFAPGFGVPEDAATGGAAAALAGAAALRNGAGLSLRIAQGIAMGRPSLLQAAAELEGGHISRVQVRGASAFVAEGQIEVPDHYLEGGERP